MVGERAAPYAFVSYASADRARVLPLVAALQGAGIAVWLDQHGIAGGENYALEIADAIEGCAAFVLMTSAASLASRNCRQEIALGWRYERAYVPLLLEPVAIPKEVAYWLEASQWVEVLDRPEAAWLPAVLAALAPHGLSTAAPERAAAQLAGREREQALLREKLTEARAGRGGLVLLGGEAGIGKTALAETALAEAARQGCAALEGHCFDLAETPPYGPWIDLFARYRPAPGGTPPPATFAARGTVGAVPNQFALFVQVQDFLAALAARQPVALLLDDLHWADPASLDLLRFLARDLAARPVLVLATYRSDELTRRHPLYALLPQLAREAGAARLDLGRLDDAAVRALVAARYALPDPDTDRLVRAVQARAEGNALFVGELLRALEEDGALTREGTDWRLGDLARAAVPAMLRQVIAGRVARLGEEAQRLLAVAAVVGHDVPLATWAATAEADAEAVLAAAEAGLEARLLVEGGDGEGVRFAHALIREALYEELPAIRRRRVHRRAGEALAAGAQPDPDTVAYHFRQAGDPRAVEWLTRASHRAGAAGALASAAASAATAEALLGDDPAQAERRAWLLYRLGFLARLDAPQRALAHLEEAIRLAETVGNPALALLARAERGYLRMQLGQSRPAEIDLAEALAARDRLTDERWEAGLARGGALAAPYNDSWPPDSDIPASRLFASWLEVRRDTLTLLWATLGRYAEVLAQGQAHLPPDAATADVRDLSRDRFTSPAHAGVLLLAMAHTHAALGRPEEALALFLKANRVGSLVRVHLVVARTLADVLVNIALPYRADQITERRELAAMMLAEYRRSLDLGVGAGQPEALRHALDLVEGDWVAAERGATALRDGRRARPWAVTLCTLARWRGEAEVAQGLVRAHLPDGPATAPGDLGFLTALALIRLAALLAIDAGTLDAARAWLACHDRWLAWSGAVLGRADGALGWAAYHRAAGDFPTARHHAERALAHATEPRQPLALLAAHRLLGELETTAGQRAAASSNLADALALADACAAPYERALTLLALADLRAAEGQRDATRALLAEVRAICEPLGAQPALDRAAALAAALEPAR